MKNDTTKDCTLEEMVKASGDDPEIEWNSLLEAYRRTYDGARLNHHDTVRIINQLFHVMHQLKTLKEKHDDLLAKTLESDAGLEDFDEIVARASKAIDTAMNKEWPKKKMVREGPRTYWVNEKPKTMAEEDLNRNSGNAFADTVDFIYGEDNSDTTIIRLNELRQEVKEEQAKPLYKRIWESYLKGWKW